MIIEIIHRVTEELSYKGFKITSVSLGEDPMKMLIEEVVQDIPGVEVKVNSVTKYDGFPVCAIPSKDAIMFTIHAK